MGKVWEIGGVAKGEKGVGKKGEKDVGKMEQDVESG